MKYLKRQMYGRAKLDLRRIRVLHPNGGLSHRLTKSQFSVGANTDVCPHVSRDRRCTHGFQRQSRTSGMSSPCSPM